MRYTRGACLSLSSRFSPLALTSAYIRERNERSTDDARIWDAIYGFARGENQEGARIDGEVISRARQTGKVGRVLRGVTNS